MTEDVFLACPRCHGRLTERDGGYACGACAAGFPVVDGLPSLFPWSTGEIDPRWAAWRAKLDLLQRWREQTWDGREQAQELSEFADDVTARFLGFVGGLDGNALEIGCGDGALRRRLPRCRYYGLDPLPLVSRTDDGAMFVRGVGEALPFPGAAFDIVFLCQALDHSFDPQRVLEEACRVLRPGGRVAVMQSLAGAPSPPPPPIVRIRTALSKARRRLLGNPHVDASDTKTHPIDERHLLELMGSFFDLAPVEVHGAIAFVVGRKAGA